MIHIEWPWQALTVQSPWGVIRAQPRIGAGDRRGRGGQFSSTDTPEGLPLVASTTIERWKTYNRLRVKLAKGKRRGTIKGRDLLILETQVEAAKETFKYSQGRAREEGWHINALGKITKRPQPKTVDDVCDIGPEITGDRKKFIEATMAAIEEVHGYPPGMDEVMVTVAGVQSRLFGATEDGSYGTYVTWFDEMSGPMDEEDTNATSAIFLSKTAHSLTFAHEMGHYLDFRVMNEEGYSHPMPLTFQGRGKKNNPAVPVIDAIKKTRGFQRLQEIRDWHVDNWGDHIVSTGKLRESGQYGMTVTIDPGHSEYILEDRELFARAYAQYLAVKSGNPVLRDGLRALREDTEHKTGRDRLMDVFPEARGVQFWENMPSAHQQWDDDDFGEIESAFDEFFASQGLLK